jgi:hypothetical protein
MAIMHQLEQSKAKKRV